MLKKKNAVLLIFISYSATSQREVTSPSTQVQYSPVEDKPIEFFYILIHFASL